MPTNKLWRAVQTAMLCTATTQVSVCDVRWIEWIRIDEYLNIYTMLFNFILGFFCRLCLSFVSFFDIHPTQHSPRLSMPSQLQLHSRTHAIITGHGGRLRDDDGDEADGYDETLVPLDYEQAGQIRDDDLYNILVGPLRKGVTLTCVMDCCHSGTVLDLPFVFAADGESEEMHEVPEFDFTKLMGLAQMLMAASSGTGGGGDPMAAAMQACCKIL